MNAVDLAALAPINPCMMHYLVLHSHGFRAPENVPYIFLMFLLYVPYIYILVLALLNALGIFPVA